MSLVSDYEKRLRALELLIQRQQKTLEKAMALAASAQQVNAYFSANPTQGGSAPSPYYHGVTDSSGIGPATSSAQMTAGNVQICSSDPSTGALTPTGVSVTVWNKSTAGGVTPTTAICFIIDSNGAAVTNWEQC